MSPDASGCAGKKRYATYAGASFAAKWLRRLNDEDVHAYRCRACGGYHLGHTLRPEEG